MTGALHKTLRAIRPHHDIDEVELENPDFLTVFKVIWYGAYSFFSERPGQIIMSAFVLLMLWGFHGQLDLLHKVWPDFRGLGIDIASRPYGKSSFNGKPIGLIGTSPGAHGGVSAVKHLQQIMPGIAGPVMQQPEAYVGMLGDAFDASGEVTKDSLKQFLGAYIQAFAAWADKQKS